MVHSRRLPRLALAAMFAVGPMTLQTAGSAEWIAEPSITARAEYNDNIRYVSIDPDPVWGAILDPRLKLQRRTELWDMTANGRLRASEYNGQDGLNSVDNFFDIAAKRRFERGSFDASAALTNDTTFQNETLDLDTGLVVNQIDRTRKDFRAAASYLFTEATWLEASLNLNTVDYDNGLIYGLFDYDVLNPGLRLVHQLNQKTQVFGIYSHSVVDYDRSDELKSTTDSLQLGGSYNFSELWKVNGSIGNRRTQTSSLVATERPGFEAFYPFIYDLVSRDAESTGLVYNATLSRAFEAGSLGLSASRSVLPSSTGTDTDTTTVTLDGYRRFTAKLSARLAVSYFQSETVGETRTLADRTRYRVAPVLTWHFDEDLMLKAGYSYTHLNRGSDGSDSVDSNAAFLGLEYTWPRWTVSR